MSTEWVEECGNCNVTGVCDVPRAEGGTETVICPVCDGACYVAHECEEAA